MFRLPGLAQDALLVSGLRDIDGDAFDCGDAAGQGGGGDGGRIADEPAVSRGGDDRVGQVQVAAAAFRDLREGRLHPPVVLGGDVGAEDDLTVQIIVGRAARQFHDPFVQPEDPDGIGQFAAVDNAGQVSDQGFELAAAFGQLPLQLALRGDVAGDRDLHSRPIEHRRAGADLSGEGGAILAAVAGAEGDGAVTRLLGAKGVIERRPAPEVRIEAGKLHADERLFGVAERTAGAFVAIDHPPAIGVDHVDLVVARIEHLGEQPR